MSGLISLDTETVGLDVFHGCLPYFVTVCFDDGKIIHWKWPVDPLTRKVNVDCREVREIEEVLADADEIVLQNSGFDVKMLTAAGLKNWPWHKTLDTLLAGHLLASNQPHNLTDMVLARLGVDIEPLEKELKEACEACRRKVQQARLKRKRLAGKASDPYSLDRHNDSDLAYWQIAEVGLESMPSAKGAKSNWKADAWLPELMADRLNEPSYAKVLEKYANTDSAATISLWKAQRLDIDERKLGKIYQERLKLLPIAVAMETKGVSVSGERLDALRSEYIRKRIQAEERCVRIARSMGYDLEMPRSGNNDSLVTFCFSKDGFNLPVVKRSKKTGAPSLDKGVLEHCESVLPENSREHLFVKTLRGKRSRDTAVSYLDSYKRFWKPYLDKMEEIRLCLVHDDNLLFSSFKDWYKLHPNLNMTGTSTLRWSSNNPNESNISKKENFNLRKAFGPAPGREWWSLDAKNIELRLPAYESGEQIMIDLFEKPDEPPYFGSNHLLASHVLHKKMFEECINEDGVIDGRIFKKKYNATWYSWTKNSMFAIQYGSVAESGTADRAAHVPGAQKMLESRFSKISELSKKQIWLANKYGYVETIPDKTVDPDRGYPMLCTRTERGTILETVPLSYHIQGTAMQWTNKAMIRCHEQLEKWCKSDGFTGFLAMQIHDEIVFDFPKSKKHPKEDKTVDRSKTSSNLWRIRILQKLMEKGGEDIGIPTPVGVEYHLESWDVGETV